jgi:hypothetical protein
VLRRATVTVVAVVAGVALTGCGSAGKTGQTGQTGKAASTPAPAGGGPASSGGSTGPGASAGSTAGGTVVAGSCVVGTWKTTGVSGALTGDGVNGTIKGGSGVTMTVAPNGATTVAFAGMKPIEFTYSVSGGGVKGTFSYGGTVSGGVKLPAAGVKSGTWQPTGTVDFSPVTVTVDVSNPAVGRVADKQPLSDFVGSGTASAGAAVDAQPLLKTGAFSCAGSTLTIAPPAGSGGVGSWTLTKG